MFLSIFAEALAAGRCDEASLVERGETMIGRRPRWLRPLARRLAAAFPSVPPTARQVGAFLDADEAFQVVRRREDDFQDWQTPVWSSRWRWAVMRPAPEWVARCELPSLASAGALAAWLGLPANELAALADWRSLERFAPPGPLRNYHYRLIPKRAGRLRTIESPKSRLKVVQRRLLHELLDRIPPHEAAHGFRRGKSIVTFTEKHLGRRAVLRMDLADFFPSLGRGRVVRLFETLGYPPDVARQLAGLCTNAAPRDLWSSELAFKTRLGDAEAMRRHAREWELLYSRPHTPQGAPTSGAIANLCAFRLDRRLARLAKRAGADYTRYADDLLFSGDDAFARRANRFAAHVAAICLDEGFSVQHRKTRIQRQAARQEAAAVVLNVHPNIRRDEYDRLKAILHNCRRHGPASQNRDGIADFRAHLLGKIAHVAMLNPDRGQRLQAIFDGIVWHESD